MFSVLWVFFGVGGLCWLNCFFFKDGLVAEKREGGERGEKLEFRILGIR